MTGTEAAGMHGAFFDLHDAAANRQNSLRFTLPVTGIETA
jgi:hypothetical protein